METTLILLIVILILVALIFFMKVYAHVPRRLGGGNMTKRDLDGAIDYKGNTVQLKSRYSKRKKRRQIAGEPLDIYLFQGQADLRQADRAIIDPMNYRSYWATDRSIPVSSESMDAELEEARKVRNRQKESKMSAADREEERRMVDELEREKFLKALRAARFGFAASH